MDVGDVYHALLIGDMLAKRCGGSAGDLLETIAVVNEREVDLEVISSLDGVVVRVRIALLAPARHPVPVAFIADDLF